MDELDDTPDSIGESHRVVFADRTLRKPDGFTPGAMPTILWPPTKRGQTIRTGSPCPVCRYSLGDYRYELSSKFAVI